MSITRRLEKLEGRFGRGEPCGTCGFDGDWSNVEIVTEVSLVTEPDEATPDERTRLCPECGFPHVIKVMSNIPEERI